MVSALRRFAASLPSAWDPPTDIPTALASLVSADVYVEKWVPFTKELAVMVVRALDGGVVAYPTVETIQKDNICHIVVAPAQIDGRVAEAAQALARAAIQSLQGPGVFGVEMFLVEDGAWSSVPALQCAPVANRGRLPWCRARPRRGTRCVCGPRHRPAQRGCAARSQLGPLHDGCVRVLAV